MADFRLKVFLSVAKTLSFTKAAHELFVTQPAVTKHIQALEKEYGLPLFTRKGSRIYLTPAGREFYDYSKRVYALHKHLEDTLNIYRDEKAGELTVGASTTIAQYILPPILAGFKKKYPKITLSLLSGNSEQIAEALMKGEIELGLVEGKIKNRGIKYEIFINDELALASRAHNKNETGEMFDAEQLKNIPLVLRERGSGTLEVFEYALRNKKIKLSDLNIEIYLGSTEAIKYYLENSNSFGVLSIRAIQKELERGVLTIKKVKGLKVTRTFDFISLQGSTLSGIASSFKKYAKHYDNKK
ncbi:MAG: selenium metabolism-associated LysR family transcriptional regulator [Bacteroidota bacterium]|jgi:DNA-binding transcriptional LysR family regulator